METFNKKDKIKSRLETIIKPYRSNIGKSLPSGKQYWTLCADCTKPGCELDQMTSCGLIKSNQFFGVDYDKETIELNKTLKTDATFLHGDFFDTMYYYTDFNPGVVNMDLLNTFATERGNIKKVFSILQKFSGVLFNINFLVSSFYVKQQNTTEIEKFLNDDVYMNRNIFENNWKKSVSSYIYKGRGPGTNMMSIGLVRT